MIRHEALCDQVALITIDRHEQRNALDVEHLDALHDAMSATLSAGARAIVVTGAGSAFCAGADLDRVYGADFRDALYRALGAITDAPVPVIAAVNGPAIGAGAQLAIACDLRVGSERARFAVPTALNGLAVDPWTVRRLAALTGGSLARNMLLGATTLDVDGALGCGLVARTGDLDVAVAWAREIAAMAPLSLTYSKRALDCLVDPVAQRSDDDLVLLFEQCWDSADVVEGRQARIEGRRPVFEGR